MSTLNVSQVSVSNAAATPIVPINQRRTSLTLINHGTNDVFIGTDATVTTSTGALLSGTKGSSLTFTNTAALYAIAATSAQTISVIEGALP